MPGLHYCESPTCPGRPEDEAHPSDCGDLNVLAEEVRKAQKALIMAKEESAHAEVMLQKTCRAIQDAEYELQKARERLVAASKRL